jgi:ATP-dependent RNA helicase DDX56/DBP9
LSFAVSQAATKKKQPGKTDEEVLAKITKNQEKLGHKIEPYAFDMKKLDGFRYRLQDALRAVTGGAIREARVRELRQELIKSEKLKRHFEENPGDLRHLRHDGELRPAKVKPHMKHVPDYLIPGGARKAAAEDIGFVPFKKDEKKDARAKRRKTNPKRGLGRKINPLQSFKHKRK